MRAILDEDAPDDLFGIELRRCVTKGAQAPDDVDADDVFGIAMAPCGPRSAGDALPTLF